MTQLDLFRVGLWPGDLAMLSLHCSCAPGLELCCG